MCLSTRGFYVKVLRVESTFVEQFMLKAFKAKEKKHLSFAARRKVKFVNYIICKCLVEFKSLIRLIELSVWLGVLYENLLLGLFIRTIQMRTVLTPN